MWLPTGLQAWYSAAVPDWSAASAHTPQSILTTRSSMPMMTTRKTKPGRKRMTGGHPPAPLPPFMRILPHRPHPAASSPCRRYQTADADNAKRYIVAGHLFVAHLTHVLVTKGFGRTLSQDNYQWHTASPPPTPLAHTPHCDSSLPIWPMNETVHSPFTIPFG